MNLINNGKYYLIVRNNNEVEIPYIDKGLYINDNKQQRNIDIAAMDLITINFMSASNFKYYLYSVDKIQTPIVDIYLAKNNTLNGKKYVNYYELIYGDNKRVEIIKTLAKKRLNGEKIENKDIENLIYHFINKLINKNTFYEFITSRDSYLDAYLKEKLIEYRMYNKLDFRIKKILNNKFLDYKTIRSIILMWNIYDSLINKYKNEYKEQDYELQIKLLDELKNKKEEKKERINVVNNILEHLDFNNIKGQITITEYLNNKEEQNIEPIEKDLNYLKNEIINKSFDNPILKELFEIGGLIKCQENLSLQIIQNLTDEDRVRL
ncbi:MAG: hypothetical protein ACK5HP_03585 [Bacilli bacterium]